MEKTPLAWRLVGSFGLQDCLMRTKLGPFAGAFCGSRLILYIYYTIRSADLVPHLCLVAALLPETQTTLLYIPSCRLHDLPCSRAIALPHLLALL